MIIHLYSLLAPAQRFQCCARLSKSCWFVAFAAAGLLITTMSTLFKVCWCCLNDSLMTRFSRFRPTASRQCFLEMASPSLASPIGRLRHRTVNSLSWLRLGRSKTRPYSDAARSLCSVVKRSCLLISAPVSGWKAMKAIAAWYPERYGVSFARPFALRRFSTRRPAFVAMRARKPWVLARLMVLGW